VQGIGLSCDDDDEFGWQRTAGSDGENGGKRKRKLGHGIYLNFIIPAPFASCLAAYCCPHRLPVHGTRELHRAAIDSGVCSALLFLPSLLV
jgi:hypothetical protein